ncbi:MAG: ATP-binding protein [Balneolaceae bacterium]
MSDQAPSIPENEFERVLKLSEFDIEYSEIHSKLNELTELAAFVTGTPISLVNLLDTNTQWTVSNHGMDINQIPREDSVCQHVILDDLPLEVEDMQLDERFKNKNYVTDDPHIRYYYGVPLITQDGYRIGAMCVMDTKLHELSKKKQKYLKIIANQVITFIENEHKLKLMHNNIEYLKEMQRKVSHDIRGPIGGIIGISEILYDQAEESKLDEFMELLNLISKGGESLLELADEILKDFERETIEGNIYANRLTLEILKSKLKNLYQPQASAKNIDLQVHVKSQKGDLPFTKHKLLQILGNLISNAIKFTPNGGTVKVSLNIEKTDKELVVIVKDSGVGMSQKQIDSLIGDKGESTKGTGKESGYGYGFKIAKHLLESIKGSLFIESTESKGTTITIHIPL